MKGNIKKVILLFLLFILILNSTAFAIIEGIEDEVTGYLIGDYKTGEILENYNIYKSMEVASISKLMSYLIIMDEIEKGLISLRDIVYIDKDTTRIKGSSLELKEGESFTVKELLEAMLVVSANDATYALSKYIASTEDSFVNRMNEKAESLGLKDTIYFNCTGLPENNVQNTMSLMDIFTLSRYIINKYPQILSITTIPYIEIPAKNYKKENTNPLLNEIFGVDGLKTGFTNKAGHCLVSTVNIHGKAEDEEDFKLIIIIMGAKKEDRRKELAKALVQYGIDNYSNKILANEDIPIDTIYIAESKNKDVKVYPSRSFSTILKKEDNITINTFIYEDLRLPLKKLDIIGQVTLSKNGEELDKIPLIVREDVKKEGLFAKMFKYFKDIIGFMFSKGVENSN